MRAILLLKATQGRRERPHLSLFRKLNVEEIAEWNTVLAHTEGCGAWGETPLRNEEQVKKKATSPPNPYPVSPCWSSNWVLHMLGKLPTTANSQEVSPTLLLWDRASIIYPGWSWAHSASWAGFEFKILLPWPPKYLGLEAYSTHPIFPFFVNSIDLSVITICSLNKILFVYTRKIYFTTQENEKKGNKKQFL